MPVLSLEEHHQWLAINWMEHQSPPLSGIGHPASFYPVKNAPVQAMSNQFLQEKAVGNSVKGSTKIQASNIHSISFIQ